MAKKIDNCVRLTICLPKSVLAIVDKMAKIDNRSRSEMVRHVLISLEKRVQGAGEEVRNV